MNENAIDRKLVCAFIEGLISDDGEREKGLEYIRSMPPVNLQPKTGHWIFQDITQGKRMWCSNCNSAFDLCCNQIKRYDEATKKEYLWGHCPWCGAKMVEPQERSGER